jgi:hypothetical protein
MYRADPLPAQDDVLCFRSVSVAALVAACPSPDRVRLLCESGIHVLFIFRGPMSGLVTPFVLAHVQS